MLSSDSTSRLVGQRARTAVIQRKVLMLIRPGSVCSISSRHLDFPVPLQVKPLQAHLPVFTLRKFHTPYFHISPKLAPLHRLLHNHLPPSKLSVKNLCSNYRSQGVLLAWQCYAKVMRLPCKAGHTVGDISTPKATHLD